MPTFEEKTASVRYLCNKLSVLHIFAVNLNAAITFNAYD